MTTTATAGPCAHEQPCRCHEPKPTGPELDAIRVERFTQAAKRRPGRLAERKAEALSRDGLHAALASKAGLRAVRRLVKGHWKGHDGMPTVADVAAALDTLLDPKPARKR